MLFLLKHDQNVVRNRNLHSIYKFMRSDKLAGGKFKRVCADLPNITILAKSTTPEKIQVTFGHAYIGNNSLWGTVTTFTLAVYVESTTVESINAECAFTSSGKNIRLLVTEVLLCAAFDNLARSKKIRDWV